MMEQVNDSWTPQELEKDRRRLELFNRYAKMGWPDKLIAAAIRGGGQYVCGLTCGKVIQFVDVITPSEKQPGWVTLVTPLRISNEEMASTTDVRLENISWVQDNEYY